MVYAALTEFQDGGPVGLVITALTHWSADNEAAPAIVAGFQDGGPVEAVIAAILAGLAPDEPEPEPEPPGDTMALAAQPEASTPIASVAGLLGQNATNAGGSIVNLFTPSQAGER